MQDEDGQTCDVHSISAGLDYPGVGPEHSYWKETGRVQYTACSDNEALAAFDALARAEGILPALESAHALAKAMQRAPRGRSTRSSSSAFPAAATGRGRSRPNPRPLERPTMSAIDDLFRSLRAARRKALMPFVTPAIPISSSRPRFSRTSPPRLPPLRVGDPYSDPIADGPVIQASYTRALATGSESRTSCGWSRGDPRLHDAARHDGQLCDRPAARLGALCGEAKAAGSREPSFPISWWKKPTSCRSAAGARISA